MISKHYIDKAIKIRKEYLSLNDELKNHLDQIKEFKDSIADIMDNFSNIKGNINNENYSTEEDARKKVFAEIARIEREAKKVEKIYKPINDRLEELSKEEKILYDNIKDRYPELSDDEIVNEIKNHIKE